MGVDAHRLASVPEELTAGVSPPTPLGVQVAKTGLRAPDADCDASASSIPTEESRATPARAIMLSFPTVMQSTFCTAPQLVRRGQATTTVIQALGPLRSPWSSMARANARMVTGTWRRNGWGIVRVPVIHDRRRSPRQYRIYKVRAQTRLATRRDSSRAATEAWCASSTAAISPFEGCRPVSAGACLAATCRTWLSPTVGFLASRSTPHRRSRLPSCGQSGCLTVTRK